MNEEYLWDKTGEPDPEIQQLEQILGTLRYQPKPLDLPVDARPDRPNRFIPLIAIAATLLVALLAGGLWLKVRNGSAQKHNADVHAPIVPPEIIKETPDNKVIAARPISSEPSKVEHSRIPRTIKRPKAFRDSNLTALEHQKAVEAKEQLMLALRLASEKLNVAQRKAQASPNQIRNQHKVG